MIPKRVEPLACFDRGGTECDAPRAITALSFSSKVSYGLPQWISAILGVNAHSLPIGFGDPIQADIPKACKGCGRFVPGSRDCQHELAVRSIRLMLFSALD